MVPATCTLRFFYELRAVRAYGEEARATRQMTIECYENHRATHELKVMVAGSFAIPLHGAGRRLPRPHRLTHLRPKHARHML